MNEQLINKLVPELREELIGLAFREIFQLQEDRFVIAFEGDEFKLLFIAIEPRQPRIYLIKRRLKDLKKERQNPSKFAVDTGHVLLGMRLNDIEKHPGERIVEFRFQGLEEKLLVAQLTGKSSNLFLLDSARTIIAAARKPVESEQSLGMLYSAPINSARRVQPQGTEVPSADHSFGTLSEFLDDHFSRIDAEAGFDALAKEARRKNQRAQAKLVRLIENLEADLMQHGDPETWKKYGDLLLANQSTVRRKGAFVIVQDLFDPAATDLEIQVDETDSIPDAAQKYFKKYAKARSAAAEIASRIERVRADIAPLENEASQIENAVKSHDDAFLTQYVGADRKQEPKREKTRQPRLPAGVRSYRSSDGFEVLVGKKATDNDFLTFRIANSRDVWMHAADYPGSHVVIRNPDRKNVPQKTLIEAAQLAAFYSQGKKQTKAAVNYTEKKFVNKPKGSAPGLVRLASFKTILVEPVFPDALQT